MLAHAHAQPRLEVARLVPLPHVARFEGALHIPLRVPVVPGVRRRLLLMGLLGLGLHVRLLLRLLPHQLLHVLLLLLEALLLLQLLKLVLLLRLGLRLRLRLGLGLLVLLRGGGLLRGHQAQALQMVHRGAHLRRGPLGPAATGELLLWVLWRLRRLLGQPRLAQHVGVHRRLLRAVGAAQKAGILCGGRGKDVEFGQQACPAVQGAAGPGRRRRGGRDLVVRGGHAPQRQGPHPRLGGRDGVLAKGLGVVFVVGRVLRRRRAVFVLRGRLALLGQEGLPLRVELERALRHVVEEVVVHHAPGRRAFPRPAVVPQVFLLGQNSFAWPQGRPFRLARARRPPKRGPTLRALPPRPQSAPRVVLLFAVQPRAPPAPRRRAAQGGHAHPTRAPAAPSPAAGRPHACPMPACLVWVQVRVLPAEHGVQGLRGNDARDLRHLRGQPRRSAEGQQLLPRELDHAFLPHGGARRRRRGAGDGGRRRGGRRRFFRLEGQGALGPGPRHGRAFDGAAAQHPCVLLAVGLWGWGGRERTE